jgi:A/G-specific adenine glycosylase
MQHKEFKKIVLTHYRQAGRKFPWRGCDPWGVMVSEFMLQQTQVERVIPYWEKWMSLWPKPRDLTKASLEDALREWSGLGYNKRCYNLRCSAIIIEEGFGGKVPDTPKALLDLPGIGPYMSGAIACFAYNYPAAFIETNIRSAILHHFFPDSDNVKDSEIMPILEELLDRDDARTWNYALMDYGASIKKTTENPNRRSAHYARQSTFVGSFRQARGSVIRALVSMGPGNAEEIGLASGLDGEKLYRVLEKLKTESLVAEEGGIYSISD